MQPKDAMAWNALNRQTWHVKQRRPYTKFVNQKLSLIEALIDTE